MHKQNFYAQFSKATRIKNSVRKFYSCNVYHPSSFISSLERFYVFARFNMIRKFIPNFWSEGK